jgi:hypothetical protein
MDPRIKDRLAGPDVTRAQFDELFIQTGRRIAELRAEAAKYRHQRNEARAELAALKAELGR